MTKEISRKYDQGNIKGNDNDNYHFHHHGQPGEEGTSSVQL